MVLHCHYAYLSITITSKLSVLNRVHHFPLTLKIDFMTLRNGDHSRSDLTKKIMDITRPPYHHLRSPLYWIHLNRHNSKTKQDNNMVFGTKFIVTTAFSSNMQRKCDLDKILFMLDRPRMKKCL